MLFSQQFVDFTLIEPYYYFITNDYYGDTHLASLLDHLFGFVPVLGDIMVSVGKTFARKILFHPVAVGSGWGTVNDNVFVRHASPHIPVLQLLALGVDVLTHYWITAYRAGSHQRNPAVRALLRFLEFPASFRTNVFFICH